MRRAALLLALALRAHAAHAAPVPEPEGYRLDGYRAPTPATVRGGRVLHTDDLRAAIARGGVVLIDVLPAPRRPPGLAPNALWMPAPRMDIPGSVWLPDVGRGALAPGMEAWFRARLDALTGGDHARPLVFYCLRDCWMSWNATKRAAAYGYVEAAWYPEGSDGWAQAGLPLARATPETPPE